MSKRLNWLFAPLAALAIAALTGDWPRALAQSPEYAEPYANIGPAGKTCNVEIGNVHHTSYSGRWVGLVGGGVVMAAASGVPAEGTVASGKTPDAQGNLQAGVTFSVKLQGAITDDSSVTGNVIEALTVSALQAGTVTVPAGTMLRGRIIAAPTGVNGFELNFHHLLSPDGKAVPIASKVVSMEPDLPAAAGGQSGAAPAATISGVVPTADGLVFLKGANLVIPAGQVLQVQLRQAAQVVSGTSPDAF